LAYVDYIQKRRKLLLTGQNEGDKSEHEAEQPEHETGKDNMWYERLLGVFGVRLSISSHHRKNYLSVVGISSDVHNSRLTRCRWCGIIGRFYLLETRFTFRNMLVINKVIVDIRLRPDPVLPLLDQFEQGVKSVLPLLSHFKRTLFVACS